MTHALIAPDNTIVRLANNIDPSTASVKAGFRFRAVEVDGKPETDYDHLSDPIYNLQTDRVLRRYVPAPLDKVKVSLKSGIDSRAELIRLQFITPGAGQALVYQRKAQEARDYLAAQSPAPEDYPVLSASVGIEGDTLADVANMVVAKENLWAGIAAAIEAKRLAGKAAIDAAENAVAACAAADAIDWTLPQ